LAINLTTCSLLQTSFFLKTFSTVRVISYKVADTLSGESNKVSCYDVIFPKMNLKTVVLEGSKKGFSHSVHNKNEAINYRFVFIRIAVPVGETKSM
jgi:hypothetical protein